MPRSSKHIPEGLTSSSSVSSSSSQHQTKILETKQEIRSNPNSESTFVSLTGNGLYLLNIPAFQRVAPRRPLIFVPGISASALAMKIQTGNNEEQWQYFWPPPAHPYNLPTSPVFPSNLPPEVKQRVLEGLTSPIRRNMKDDPSVKAMGLWPSCYDYLINALELSGYTLNVNFWIFPYDWRQSNRISGKLLAHFIEEKVGKTNSIQDDGDGGGVDIINHSMGGFVTRAALVDGAPIRRVVYIASPHYGSPLSYFTLQKDVPFHQFLDYVNEPAVGEEGRTFDDQLKDAYRTFPSMYELLPDHIYLDTKPLLYSDDEPIYGVDKTYFEHDLVFPKEVPASDIRHAMNFKDCLKDKLPACDKRIFYSESESTDDMVVHQKRSPASSNKSRSNADGSKSGLFCRGNSGEKGDGWVPRVSGMASMSGERSPYSKSFKGTHLTLPSSIDVIKATLGFLTGNEPLKNA